MLKGLKITHFNPSPTWITLSLLCFLSIAVLNPLQAQEPQIRKNNDGETLIVYPDGSWQYYSDYLSGKKERNPADMATYPIFEGTIEPLDGNIKVTEDDLYKIAERRSQLADEAAKIAQLRWEKAQEARAQVEKELQQVLSTGQATQEVIAQLNMRLKAATRAEQESQIEAQDAHRESNRADMLIEKGGFVDAYKAEQKKRMESQASRRDAYKARSYDQALPLTDNYVGINQQDLILNPPTAPCGVAFEGMDSKSGNYRKDLDQQFLFSHTDDRLRVYLKDKEYLRCEGYFSANGGYRYLMLEFTFAYPNAREAYGFIEKGSILTIMMLNGDYVNLRSGVMDRGSYDTETELLTYRVHYPIDRSQMNYLKNSEVDAIRVFWSSGFEEYEVFQLDFFSNQLRCID
ncbi:hypothetical protein [Flavilitoribacter nigricans]|uniref:Uncharacterized protein n=1 Tax=Flavilitoribacter nigricans (strain ATCC 23147 / DSM 23189 / NBRC 102662 / NCIMB 1420 / SS-2) TaxID=1122177 RepID=A0A2D0N9X5_FLAN2|nr:hypothetical protein [Flavilitoribacter nigricans]PHN05176.1 hypothetical protein CRP01_16790 [Flavilitoribacter nigricans DSM 23189 = NBRC 102662]